MESVQMTKRKISNVWIILAPRVPEGTRHRPNDFYKLTIADIVKILKQFSANVKHFKLEIWHDYIDYPHIEIETSDLLQILSLVPNAEHLEMINVIEQALRPTREQTYVALDQLKTLEISKSRRFLVVFNSLPPGVLKEFNVSYCDLNSDGATEFLTKQPNIKKLTLFEVSGPHNIFDHLALESFSFRGYDSTHLAHFLSKQIQLTSLTLRGVQLNESGLDLITNQLTNLEHLTLEIAYSDMRGKIVETCKRIAQLKKLKESSVRPSTLQIITALSGLDNSQISTLHLMDISCSFRDRRSVPINVTSALVHSMTNLNSLVFNRGCPTTMQRFNFVEVLEMRFDKDIDAESLSKELDVEKCFNPKLTALSIDGHFKWNVFTVTKLIAMYPNLNHLKIIAADEPLKMPYNAELILNGFKKINSLKIRNDNDWKMTGKLFEYLIKRKDQLKLIEFGKLTPLRHDHKREIFAAFHVVEFVNGNLFLKN